MAATPPIPRGQKVKASSVPVVLASDSDELLINAGTDITSPVTMPDGGVGIRGWLSAIWTKLNAVIEVTGVFWQATQPVSAATLPLPENAAMETTLAAVEDNIGAQSDAAASTDTGTFSLIALFKRLLQGITSLVTNTTDGVVTGPTSVTSATTIFSVDTSGYQSAVVQVTANASFNTITFEMSGDNGVWIATPGYNTASPGVVASTTSVATSNFIIPFIGKHLKVRVSTYLGGTTTAILTLKKSPAPLPVVTAAITGSVQVIGPAAHGAAISGAPVRIGGRALTSNYTALTTGQVADEVCTLVGAKIVRPYSIPEADWQYAAPSGGKTATGGVTIAAAPAAGLRNYITGLQISNAGAAGTDVQIKDGAGGTVIWRGYIPAGGISNPALPTPIRQPTTATLLEIDLSSGTTVVVYVNCQGFFAP